MNVRVIVQILCSYVTLPLYALVTQVKIEFLLEILTYFLW